jgi:hypothetical protein
VGEAEEHEAPPAAQAVRAERLIVLVHQRERRQRPWRHEQRRRGNSGLRVGLMLEQPARRQNAAGDGYNGDNDCERDRLSS